jgi:hypothetical protein
MLKLVLFPGRPDPARAFFGTARAWLSLGLGLMARAEKARDRLGLSSGQELMVRAGSSKKARTKPGWPGPRANTNGHH